MNCCPGISIPLRQQTCRKPPEMSNVVPLKQPKPRKIPDLLQLRIELAWIKPKIWRRIVVPESITLGNLHHVLQMAFDWGDYHLHEFEIGGERFGIPDPEFDWEPVRSALRIQLKTALGGMTAFKYIYDFGDHWEHRIKVEKTLPGDPELSHRALCLGGANAAPPEDVGGAPGYADFVFAIADPNHPERQQMLEWYGDSFDPTHFDDIALNLAYQDLKI
jgi:hypothetical protein